MPPALPRPAALSSRSVASLPRVLRPEGAPLRLPAVLDRASEGWWRLPPRARRTIVGAALLIATLTVLARVALSPYGPPVPVVVATRDLPVGPVVSSADVASLRWPRSLVPDGVLTTTGAAVGSTLAIATTSAGALTDRHVRPSGVSTMLAPGTAALPVRRDQLPGLTVGARVDLVIRSGDGTGRTAVRGAEVLALEDGLLWLEVPRGSAADVSAAAGRDALLAVLLPD
jgi:pilus assembly protein CpaB